MMLDGCGLLAAASLLVRSAVRLLVLAQESRRLVIFRVGRARLVRCWPAVLLLLVAVSCSTLRVLDAETTNRLFPFLKGPTDKAAVIGELGERWYYSDPSGRIFVYGLRRRDAFSLEVVKYRSEADHELVLIFDDHDRLTRHSLIKVK